MASGGGGCEARGGRGAPPSATARRDRRDYFRHVLAAVRDRPMAARGGSPSGPAVRSFTSPDMGEVAIELLPSEQRVYGSEELGLLRRDATAPIPEAVEVDFALRTMSASSDVDVQLAGPDVDVLRARGGGGQAAPPRVRRRLRDHRLVPRRQAGIKPAADPQASRCRASATRCTKRSMATRPSESNGAAMTSASWSAQPRDERPSLGDLENMRIRTPDGGQVPFSQVAIVVPGRGCASIRRVDCNRTVNVTASIDRGATSADAVIADRNARIPPQGRRTPRVAGQHVRKGAGPAGTSRRDPLGRRGRLRSPPGAQPPEITDYSDPNSPSGCGPPARPGSPVRRRSASTPTETRAPPPRRSLRAPGRTSAAARCGSADCGRIRYGVVLACTSSSRNLTAGAVTSSACSA